MNNCDLEEVIHQIKSKIDPDKWVKVKYKYTVGFLWWKKVIEVENPCSYEQGDFVLDPLCLFYKDQVLMCAPEIYTELKNRERCKKLMSLL